MSVDQINNPPMIQQTMLRMVQGGKEIMAPTFGEKFKMGLAKFGSFFAKLGGGLLSLFPGWGKIAGSALYGLGNVAERSYQNQVNKRMENLQMDEMMTQGNYQFLTPGFGMFGTPNNAVNSSIPDGYLMQERTNTVNNREQASFQAIQNMS